MFRALAVVLLGLSFATGIGCGIAPSRPVAAPAAIAPELRLPPAALPGGLALQQRLTFRHGDRQETVDALVEADAQSVRVLVHAQGQVALRLAWDGHELQEVRAEWLPASLQGGRVLSDLQLAYWPLPAIAAALPGGWQVAESAGVRTLADATGTVVEVRRPQPGVVQLRNLRDGYELRIESQPVTP